MTPSCLPSDGASTKSRGNHNALKALLVTAPAALREQLRGRSAAMLVRQAAALEPGPLDTPTAAAKFALRCLARRYQALHAEVATLDTELKRLTAKAAPGLVARFGVGPDSAGALLVAAGDNPGRLRSDACFAMLCGSSPIQASSGKTRRHRLNRGRAVALAPADQGLHGTASQGRQDHQGDHPLLEALRRPRAVHSPQPDRPHSGHLTSIRASWRCPAGNGRP